MYFTTRVLFLNILINLHHHQQFPINFILRTSVGASEYSFTRSTDTMFVSISLLIRTIQFRVLVTLKKKQIKTKSALFF